MSNNPPIWISVNKRELLTHQMIKLVGSTKCKITKDENGETLTHLEITEVVLVYRDIVNNDY